MSSFRERKHLLHLARRGKLVDRRRTVAILKAESCRRYSSAVWSDANTMKPTAANPVAWPVSPRGDCRGAREYLRISVRGLGG